ncbi:MAG: DUF899 family protein [Armatimonadetes bacterium]|nr:DUF899 family protein [Armatimonadota bacterium]
MPSPAELESQIIELKQQLAEARKANPPEPVANYEFESADGPVKLAELFGGKDFLYVIHNMGKGCQYCTLWADTLNPIVPILRTKAEVALCNMDSLETQRAMQASHNWDYRMVRDADRAFSQDMGYFQPAQESGDGRASLLPGISAFRKSSDGTVTRLNNTPFGPGDDFCPIWPLWELIGGSDWEPAG